MKKKEYEVHGYYPICNIGGIEVSIEEGCDIIIHWRYVVMDNKPSKWFKSKVYYTNNGRIYFRANTKRIYLDEVTRV